MSTRVLEKIGLSDARYRATLRSSATILATRVPTLAALGIASLLIARWLGPDERGVFAVVVAASNLVAIALGMGVGPAIVRFVASGHLAAGTALRSLVRLVAARTAVLAVAVTLGTALGLLDLELLILIATLALAQQSLRELASLFLALGSFDRYAVIGAGGVAGSVAAAVTAYFTIDAIASLVAFTAGLGAVVVLLYIRALRRISQRGATVSLRQFFAYGVPADLSVALLALLQRFDILLVAAFAGKIAAGIYSIASLVAEILWPLSQSVAAVVFSRSAATGFRAETRHALAVSQAVTGAFALVLAVGVVFLTTPLLGPSYEDAIIPTLVLLPGVTLFASANVALSYLAGVGEAKLTLYLSAGAFAGSVLLDFALIPPFGAVGAAVAASITYAGAAVVSYVLFVRHVPESP